MSKNVSNNNKADLIFKNAHIITMDSHLPEATTVAIKDDLIVDVGSEDLLCHWQNDATEIVDMNKKTILPAFIESHMHPILYAKNLLELDCRPSEVSTITHMMENLKEKVQTTPEEQWIQGYGWNETKLEEKRPPTRWELDQVAPNHPVVLKRTCNHISVVNSKAIEFSNITKNSGAPQGGYIGKDAKTGEVNGLLQDNAQNLIKAPDYSIDEIIKGFKKAQKNLAKWGITTVHDMSTQQLDFKIYQKLISENNLKIRIRPWFWAIDGNGFKGVFEEVLGLGVRSGLGCDLLKIQGVKFMLDGGGSGATAAVSLPYESVNNRGILYYDENVFAPYVQKSVDAGLRVAVHATGDRAIEVAIKSFEQVQKKSETSFMRNRIEHCALPNDSHLSRMKKLNLIAASSVGFIYHTGDSYLYHLGNERMKKLYPHKSFKEYGIVSPGNSDLPIVNGNPWEGVYGAVTRKNITGIELDHVQNISVEDALKAYTKDAAYSSLEEEKLGVIKKEAKADLIVISENPFSIEHEKLKEIEVEKTFMNGELIYSNSC